MPLPNKVYDILRWVANYVFPGLGTLYFALAQIWGFPYGQEIVGSITAIVTFLNILLGASNVTYNQQTQIEKLKLENSGLLQKLNESEIGIEQ